MKASLAQRLGLSTLVFSLACAGFTEAFNEGMSESTTEVLDEARTLVAACAVGQPQVQISAMIDHVDRSMSDGSLPMLQAAIMLGSIKSAIEDGCDANDIENLTTLYPDLGSITKR